MPSRASKPKKPAGPRAREDVAEIAFRILQESTGEAPRTPAVPPPPDTSGKNPHAVALSKLGASKGGKARAKSMSKAKRRRIAKKAAKARWSKRR